MQVSGFAETLQRKPRRRHPERLPAKNKSVSPVSIAPSANGSRIGARNKCPATAAPPVTSDNAAGEGRPIDSAKTMAATMMYPWREIREASSVMGLARLTRIGARVQRAAMKSWNPGEGFDHPSGKIHRFLRGAMSSSQATVARRHINL